MKSDLVCTEDRCWCDLDTLWSNSGGSNWGVPNSAVSQKSS